MNDNNKPIAVIGGGIAALTARSALHAAGFPVLALVGTEPPTEPERLLVCPRLQRGESLHARFLRDAYREAHAFYEQPAHQKAIVARGALRLAQNAQERQRGQALAQECPSLCRWCDASEAQRTSGLKRHATRWGGTMLPHALVLDPRSLLAKDHTSLARRVLRATEEADGGWRLLTENSAAEQKTFKTDRIVLALGAHLSDFLRQRVFSQSLPPLHNLLESLQTSRGRIDICNKAMLARPPLIPVCASGWIMPFAHERVAVVRGLAPSRTHEREQENRRRLDQWCGLSEDKARFEKPFEGLRLSTRDRLPLLGALGKTRRLFVFAALGGHGFLTAPLCAQQLVRLVTRKEKGQDATQDETQDATQAATSLLSPQRFLL